MLSFCRSASVGNVIVTLTHVEGEAAVAALDRFTLSPGATINQVYPVPGVVLAVSAEAVSDAPTAVDVLIWGYRNSAEGSPPLNPDVPSKVDGTLIVHVVGNDGAPAGASVEITLDGVHMGLTGDDGSLTIMRLESEYRVEARHPDGRSGAVSMSIVGGQTTEVTITLTQA